MNRINLISLGVKNMEKSLAFYKNIGFKTYEKEKTPAIVFFDNQGSKLGLYPIEELAKDINIGSSLPISQGGFCGITLACNMKSKEEVDQFIYIVAKQGGAIVKQPTEVFWGGYSGYFQDLDGYYWEVAYSDLWQFDDNDMLIIDEKGCEL